MSVTVVSCVYGRTFSRYIDRWTDCIRALAPRADRVIVASDAQHRIPIADTLRLRCTWRHPQAFYLNAAIRLVDTEWVWVVDIDDMAMRDGLAGIEDVDADVWQMGFVRSDGVLHLPPALTNDEYLAADGNQYVSGSAFRVDAFREAGGFQDVAFQDWALWRRLASDGATFQSSGRPHFHYMRHPDTRGETELTIDVREQHTREMLETEAQLVA